MPNESNGRSDLPLNSSCNPPITTSDHTVTRINEVKPIKSLEDSISNPFERITDNRMAQIGRYYKDKWDVIPLYPILQRGKFVRHGKAPIGKGWQKRIWNEYDLVHTFHTNPKYNVGIRHCSPDNTKLCEIGFDFDGITFMTHSNLLRLLKQEQESTWRDEMIMVFEESALMQSSPQHKHLLICINEPIAKIIINHSEGEMLEILGQGNQTVIPPSICDKPGMYDAFQRYWIDNRNTILHISNDTLEQFVLWMYSLCPNDQIKERKKVLKLVKVKPRRNQSTVKYQGILEFDEKRFRKVVKFFRELDIYPAGIHTYHNQFRAIILWLKTNSVVETQIREIVQRVSDTVKPTKDHQQTVTDLLSGIYLSKKQIFNIIKEF